MIDLAPYEVWFVTGSQHLYGPETLQQVEAHSQEVAGFLNDSSEIPIRVVFKSVLTTPEEILQCCLAANSNPACIGLICWMHTFSPAKMWIRGLQKLHKPHLHLHTQYNRDIPWGEIDMDFMNLNQSAHGGREFGFINSRMRLERKVVVGHWQEEQVLERIQVWTRVACAYADMQQLKVARLGDNMREVAVTEGDKVSAQIQFGYSVNGYGMGDLWEYYQAVNEGAVAELVHEYLQTYEVAESLLPTGEHHESLKTAARIELALSSFLHTGGFGAFTDTFENLHGLPQLPGIAVQRLMAKGYGFGAEGDWKTAALVRSMKVMGRGLEGGNSFMEDYTYHFDPTGKAVLGAHMLEICESIAEGKPRCEIHPLGIGGKADPVRLVFPTQGGPALNASVVDLGNRFRLLINTVEAIPTPQPLPQLPVARVLWEPHPDLSTAAGAWILAGGAHHTCFSQSLSPEYLIDFAEMTGIEYILIDPQTQIHQVKQALRWNEAYYHLFRSM